MAMTATASTRLAAGISVHSPSIPTHAVLPVAQSLTKSEVVSSEREKLILVDRDDQEIGHLDKSACHDGNGLLHRAFSLFIFNSKGELLLQQRAAGKRL